MTTPDFRPTHVVPQDGLPAWEAPDVSLPTEPLDPLLPVRLIGRRGDWGQILCANGWSAWVDGRLLVSVPQEPPAAGAPMARAADPRPLLARVEESLSQYRRAAEDLTAGRTDGEDFRRRTRGLRVGMVVDGEAVWLYDAEHERWMYCDGTRLTTYAASSSPGNNHPPPREPTQVAAAAQPPADPPSAPAAPRDPTQVVTPATPDDAGIPTGPDDARAAPQEPTRVVAPPANDRSPDPGRPVGHSPRTPDDAAPPEPEPTRVVDPPATGPSGRPDSGPAGSPEPTRAGDAGAAHPGADGSPDRDREATRLAGHGDGAPPHPSTRPGDG